MVNTLWLFLLGNSLVSALPSLPNTAGNVVYEEEIVTVYACPAVYSQTATAAYPIATSKGTPGLLPGVHHEVDLKDLKNLVPCDSTDLYYAVDGTVDTKFEHQFATITANHTHPAVVLEHTEYVTDVKCTASGLSLLFTNVEAFNAAKNSWSGTFILVTHTSGCGSDSSSSTRTFFLVGKVYFNQGSLSVGIDCNEIALGGAATDVTITYGTKPSTYDPANGYPVSGGKPSGTTPVVPVPTIIGSSNSTVPPGNSTGGTPGDLGCPTVTGDVDGFPAVACGSDFDTLLDDKLGYLNFDTAHFSESLEEAAPGLGDYDLSDYQDDDIPGENNTIFERSANFKRVPKGQTKTFTPKTQPKVDTKKQAPKTVAVDKGTADAKALQAKQAQQAKADAEKKALAAKVKAAEPQGLKNTKAAPATDPAVVAKQLGSLVAGASKVADVAAELLKDHKYTKSINIDLAPSGPKVTSPFGEAAQILSKDTASDGALTGKAEMFCIDCSVKGDLHLEGEIKFQLFPSPKLISAFATIKGGLDANFNSGLVVDGEYKKKFEKQLAETSYKPFDIEKILAFTPTTSFSAELDLDIASAGSIKTTASVKIPNFAATIDLVDTSKSKSAGYQPEFNTNVDPTGKIVATTGFSMPLRIGISMHIIPLGDASKVFASVVNKPGVGVKTTYMNVEDITCPDGISYALALSDTTALVLPGGVSNNLNSYSPVIGAPGCKKLSADGTNTPVKVDEAEYDTAGEDGTTLTGEVPGSGGIEKRQNNSTSTDDETLDINESLNTKTDYDNDAAFADAAYASDKNTVNDDEFTFLTITDASKNYVLFNGQDGNFGLTTTEVTPYPIYFSSYEDIVVTDPAARAIFYYPTTMTKYGVSRLRMNDYEHIPKTADFINLTPVNDDGSAETPGLYVAVDTTGAFFFTVFCLLRGQNDGKIFVVKDLDLGIETLLKGGLENTITGGVVTYCTPIGLLADNAGL